MQEKSLASKTISELLRMVRATDYGLPEGSMYPKLMQVQLTHEFKGTKIIPQQGLCSGEWVTQILKQWAIAMVKELSTIEDLEKNVPIAEEYDRYGAHVIKDFLKEKFELKKKDLK